MSMRSLFLAVCLPAAGAFAFAALDAALLKGPSCIIQDSLRKSETVLAPTLTRVNLLVTDGYAQATVTQAFVNPLAHKTEIAYVFPLPEKGSVHAMAFQTQGKLYRAHIEEKALAQTIYDSVKNSGGQAGLLLQERPNLFQQKLANLPAGDTVYVEIRVSIPLKYVDGWYELAFPTMVGERYPSAGATEPAGTLTGWNPPENRDGPSFQFNVLVQSNTDLDSIVSPTHPLESNDPLAVRSTLVSRGLLDTLANPDASFGRALWLVNQTTYPNRDFVLRLHRASTSIDGTMLSCKPSGRDTGFYRLTVFPDLSAPAGETAKDVVLLIDRSGSQFGWPLASEKTIATRILSQLNSGDNFTVMSFSDDVLYALGKTPVPATSANIATATSYINNIQVAGGTQLLAAIQASLAVPATGGRQRVYIFLTDGFITDETSILSVLQKASPAPQVVTFGCGGSLNRYFLEESARIGNGFATELTESDDLVKATNSAWSRIASPQVNGLSSSFGGFATMDSISTSGSMLYRGLPWTVSGRYVSEGAATLTLKGTRNGQAWNLTRAVRFSGTCPTTQTVPLIWARETIGDLETREGTTSANKARIIDLSKAYQVLSKYTAFLAVDGIPLSEAQADLSSGMNLATDIAAQQGNKARIGQISQTRQGGHLLLSWSGKDTPRAWILTNMQGRAVAQWGAANRVDWDGRNLMGARVPAGTYILSIVTAGGTVTLPVSWMP
jgi:Ca-activated chloride channel homolog